MTVTELLEYFRKCDVELWADGNRLCYSAPAGVITPALLSELTNCKWEILALLRQPNTTSDATSQAVREYIMLVGCTNQLRVVLILENPRQSYIISPYELTNRNMAANFSNVPEIHIHILSFSFSN